MATFQRKAIVKELAKRLEAAFPSLEWVAIGHDLNLPGPENAPAECMVLELRNGISGPSTVGMGYFEYTVPITLYFCRRTSDEEEIGVLISEKGDELGNWLMDQAGLPGFRPDGIIKIEEGWPKEVDFRSEMELLYEAANINLSVVAVAIEYVVTARGLA